MNKKLDLFVTFFRIGAFTFGGGYAMVPLIKSEAADKKGWISEEDMLDIIAIAESTPGPIAINSATFVGYKTAGVLGSACAVAPKVFGTCDFISSNVLMMAGALAFALIVGWKMPREEVLRHVRSVFVYHLIRYVAPVMIVAIAVTNLL